MDVLDDMINVLASTFLSTTLDTKKKMKKHLKGRALQELAPAKMIEVADRICKNFGK